MEKPDSSHPSLPHVATINGFQVLPSSITCLPSYPIGRRYLPYASPHPGYLPHPISKWPAKPLSHSLYPGYKSVLRTPAQRQFSLELVLCSNRVSHSNKLDFPLILPHVWKFFSNPYMDSNSSGGNKVIIPFRELWSWKGSKAKIHSLFPTVSAHWNWFFFFNSFI